MAVKAVKVERRGGLLVVTTQEDAPEDGQAPPSREWVWTADPPEPPTAEELANWQGDGRPAQIGPEGETRKHTPEEWVRQCAEESVRNHAAELPPAPAETEDLTHLLG